MLLFKGWPDRVLVPPLRAGGNPNVWRAIHEEAYTRSETSKVAPAWSGFFSVLPTLRVSPAAEECHSCVCVCGGGG